MQKVSLYVRQRGTRAYQPADPKGNYPMGMIFVLRYVRDGKRCWETLTGFQTYQSAKATAMRREIDFFTGEQNDPPKPEPVAIKPKPVVGPGLTLDMAIDRYVENVKTKSARTAHGYSYTLKQFYQSCRSKTLSEVTKQDLYDFIGYLRREGLGDRTVHNRVGEVVTFLRHFGVKDVTVRVKYVEQKVRAYRPDELKALFAATTPDEWLLWQFYLCTGAREQEVMNATWADIDFVDGLFTVRAKADWKPKDYEEREIPIPDFLLVALKERKSTGLIFPTKEGKKDGHMLRRLKELAIRAGLSGNFKLHTWRKSYATLQHRAGLDARTIQKRLGHSDLSTTLAYLEGEEPRSERSRQQVNGTFAVLAKRDEQTVVQ